MAILLLLALVLSAVISVGNSYFNEEYQPGDIARENVKSPADLTVPESDITIKKGEIIVREGEKINEEHRKKLSAVHAFAKQERFTAKKFLSFFVLLFLLIAIIIEYAEKNIKKFTLSVKDLLFGAVFTVFSVLLVKTCSLIFEYYAPSHIEQLFYVIPIFLFGIVFRIVLFSEAAIIFSAIFSIVLGFTFENSLAIFLYAFVGNILASYFSGNAKIATSYSRQGCIHPL